MLNDGGKGLQICGLLMLVSPLSLRESMLEVLRLRFDWDASGMHLIVAPNNSAVVRGPGKGAVIAQTEKRERAHQDNTHTETVSAPGVSARNQTALNDI